MSIVIIFSICTVSESRLKIVIVNIDQYRRKIENIFTYIFSGNKIRNAHVTMNMGGKS